MRYDPPPTVIPAVDRGSVVSRQHCSGERIKPVNVSAVGSNPYVHPASSAQKSIAAVQPQPQRATPVDADGDHDGDTAVGDRLDVRG